MLGAGWGALDDATSAGQAGHVLAKEIAASSVSQTRSSAAWLVESII